MRKSYAARIVAGAGLVCCAAALMLHGCREQPTEPVQMKARGMRTFRLTILGDGSSAAGSLISNTGGLNCSVAYASDRVTITGTCDSTFAAGTVVALTATPPANGGTVAWTGCDRANTDEALSCWVTLNGDRTIKASFKPAPATYVLTVQRGAGGGGSVTSSPAGIACTFTPGSAQSGCSARFPNSSSVTLNASATSGKPIKAWAGGECEKKGSGVGSGRGTCAVRMTQAQTVVVSFQASATDAATLGEWSAPLAWPHVAIHGTLLPNGLVITWGRKREGMLPNLWNPATPLAFTQLLMPSDYFCSGHVLMPDGRLFVDGGHTGTCNFGLKTAYLFSTATNRFVSNKKMSNGRWYPSALTLASGGILAVSGGDTAGVVNLIPEIWKKGAWRSLTTASRNVPYYPMLFAAPNGRVFMAGPEQQSMWLNTSGTGNWLTGPLSNFGVRDYGSAVMYDVGKILMVGGNEATPTNTAEIINLTTDATWHTIDPMAVARRQVNATLLADGKVLVTGGTNAPGFNEPATDTRVLNAELWDPVSQKWSLLAAMTHYRLYHSIALLLPDGRVLSTGSGSPAATGLSNDLTAEIFSPPYLFNADGTPATRPTITTAPASVGYGQVFTVSTPDAASITKVTWIRLSSVTHSTNMNQRMNYLTFSAPTSSSLSVTAPAGLDLSPPGHYLLFIVNGSGVPSVAKIVQIQ